MTHNDLVEKLQEMLATATWGRDMTATVLLFGVLFNEDQRGDRRGRVERFQDRRRCREGLRIHNRRRSGARAFRVRPAHSGHGPPVEGCRGGSGFFR